MEQSDKKYPIYFKTEDNTVFKQISDIEVYYVQVVGYNDGSFIHQRGKLVIDPTPVDLSKFKVATEADYTDQLINYFAADKKLREKFIQDRRPKSQKVNNNLLFTKIRTTLSELLKN
jgi:hypothetical protein